MAGTNPAMVRSDWFAVASSAIGERCMAGVREVEAQKNGPWDIHGPSGIGSRCSKIALRSRVYPPPPRVRSGVGIVVLEAGRESEQHDGKVNEIQCSVKTVRLVVRNRLVPRLSRARGS